MRVSTHRLRCFALIIATFLCTLPLHALPASADEHRSIVGLATTSALVTDWWHGYEYGEAAVDLVDNLGPPAGTNVWYQTHDWSGSGQMLAVAEEYQITTTCTGRYVHLYDAGGNSLGRLTYVHIDPTIGHGDWWAVEASGWTFEFLGTVSADQPDGCDWWDVHLHQGADSWATQIEENLNLQNLGNPIQPTGDYANRWLHKITLIDSDGDGCADIEELGPNPYLGGTRNPHNFFDFYDVPVPTAFNGGTLANRDKAVSMVNDVLAVMEYVGTSDGGIPNGAGRDYDQDRNGDGQDDGLLYDRRVGATWSDAPDGAITIIIDALLVLAQCGHTCQAAP